MKSPKTKLRHRGAGQEHPEMISKRSETFSDVGRMSRVGEGGARAHEAQPGMGRQQPPAGADVQAVAERGKT